MGSPLNMTRDGKDRLMYFIFILVSFLVTNCLIEMATDYDTETFRFSVDNYDQLYKPNLKSYSHITCENLHIDPKFCERHIFIGHNETSKS